MERKALAVITAMITSTAIMVLGWIIATKAPFSTPSQMEYVTQAEISQYAYNAPPLTYAIALVAYALAGFAGGFIVTKMARRWTTGGYGLSLLVGALLTVFAVGVYFLVWSGPVWFLIGALVIFIPLSFLAHRLAEGQSHPHVPETN